jgi:hypothetical protein
MERGSVFFDSLITWRDNNSLITPTAVSALLASATLTEGPPPLINPKTRMKTRGKPKLKATEEGLLKIAFRLALVIASIALS